MAEKITKESFAYFTLLNLLSDQEILLKGLHDKKLLTHLTTKPGDEKKLITYLKNVSNSVELLERGNNTNNNPFRLIFPKTINSWPVDYSGPIEEKINVLMLETQAFSLFPYRVILKESLKEQNFVDISYTLFGLINIFFAENMWTEENLNKLKNYYDERLSEYLETFLDVKNDADLFKFGKAVSRNILKNEYHYLVGSALIVSHTTSILKIKKPMFKKYKNSIL